MNSQVELSVHCHIFYNDLVDEFVTQLAAMPFKFDAFFISVADDAARKKCESVFRKIPTLENIGCQSSDKSWA